MALPGSAGSVASGPLSERGHRPAGAFAGLLFLPLVVLGLTARIAGAATAKVQVPGVTIEAAREHALRLQADRFVSSVVVKPWNDGLYRWNSPICPLVAGMPKALGELILHRITKAAIDAHAPLAGSVCSPNLFVVATRDDPNPLLEMWWKRAPGMFNTKFGVEAARHFIHSTGPIRVWYNTYSACGGGPAAPPSTIAISGNFAVPVAPAGCDPFSDLGTRLARRISGSNISAVIVVIDGRQIGSVTVGQMADYISLVGLAELRRDSGPTPVPSILELFGHGMAPPALTSWDRALLYALYNTDQMSKTQVQEVEIAMTKRIAR